MLLQEHDLPSILITEVNMHRMVDNLAMRETEPVQIIQKVTHAFPKSFIIIITITIMNHVLEHQLATLPLRLGHDGVQYHVILFVINSIINTLARTLRKLTLLVEQVVSLVLDLVQITELEPAHELLLHVLLDGVNLAHLQHGDVSGVNAISDPGQPRFGFGAVEYVADLLHDVINERL